jgi:hypothetical protein
MTWHADPGQERSSPPLPAASQDMSTGHNKREGHCRLHCLEYHVLSARQLLVVLYYVIITN